MPTAPWPRRQDTRRGFTLIEILVVLVVVGLMAGLALPRLFAMAQRFEWASQREQLRVDVANLGYQAYRNGRSQVLDAAARPDAAVLHVPPGWRLEVPAPIRYHFSGVCGGGRLTVFGPDGRIEQWQLAPPFCKPETVPGAAK